ncbi:septum formation initiator family protein [Tenacibaculum finnmarkense genomovar finnmarkense]|uniref:Septum formation initiator n=1 Tax=Tenacibaculum finnmarkense genomovar finnmarkense TaxID=1458503 RepID=A0AAP1RFJ5_9FLAO|nr:septum formation initiator family protein [Tenacibaculum finnmarkense]MBE7652717.1 septum formation initiator [Tenacibaculum finnmarkense genomovar finnmarkense]MBE7661307.1 septum formation initiator [Tenacibaculum finnmarkense genomovar finnmarkense]MBE7693122.1 septum formation initiator [Tenacibaculum finnmarkense genomovar finnmarkense]MBE7695006.1 septum formation initiator [Tenacibaculum finnmarkense genomovar finnmarkense]MCD8403361.1 septum formation initiator family protein [Tenac
MNLKSIKNTPYYKVITNPYALILTVFVIWMGFFDENSYLTHREFNKEIEKLNLWIAYHEKKIKKDKETINKLQNSVQLEHYARERYLMKKENEDIYIIEFDTIPK